MSAIYKYPITALSERFQVAMHTGAQILSVQIQEEVPTFWALAELDAQITETKTILCVGTGHERYDLRGARFIGTVQMYDGRLVLHFFEATP